MADVNYKTKPLHAVGHKPAPVVYAEGTTYGPIRDLRGAKGLFFSIFSTAEGGTATLDTTIEHSFDGVSGWTTLITFTQITGANAAEDKAPTLLAVGRFVRTKNVVAGTGTPTMTAAVYAHYETGRGDQVPGEMN